MWFFIVAGIFVVTSLFLDVREQRKFADVSVAVTFVPLSNINLVIRNSSLGKCPKVDLFLDSVLIAKTSNAL